MNGVSFNTEFNYSYKNEFQYIPLETLTEPNLKITIFSKSAHSLCQSYLWEYIETHAPENILEDELLNFKFNSVGELSKVPLVKVMRINKLLRYKK